MLPRDARLSFQREGRREERKCVPVCRGDYSSVNDVITAQQTAIAYRDMEEATKYWLQTHTAVGKLQSEAYPEPAHHPQLESTLE